MMRSLLATVTAATALAAVAAPASAHRTPGSDAVSAWNANAGKAAIAACISPGDDPLHESRMYAMTHLAIHDALNAIDRRSRPYAFNATAKRGASPDAAVAAAAHDVLVALVRQISDPFPPACVDAGVATVETDYAAALAAIPDDRHKARGIEVGQAAAAAILALRAADGSDTPLVVEDFPQGTAPGEYRFTPDRPFAFAPGWGTVTPFVLDRSSQFRPGPPYPVTSRKYAADLNEIKALGGDGVTTPSARTPEQTEIALFWVESSPLAVEPDRQNGLSRARSMGAGATVRPAQHGPRRRLRQLVRDQVPLRLLATGHGDPRRRRRRKSAHQRRPDMDAAGDHTADSGLRLGARRPGRRGLHGPEAVLRHRPHRLHDLQPDAARPEARAPTRRRSRAATPASPPPRRRTGSRASLSDSTSARRWTKGSSTATGSATSRSTASCAPCAEHARDQTAPPATGGAVGSSDPPGCSRARSSSANIAFSRERSTTRSRSEIVATSSDPRRPRRAHVPRRPACQ